MRKLFLDKFKKIWLYFFKDSCECGRMKSCPRKVNVDVNGNITVENHFECKSIQDQNRRLDDWYDNTLAKK